MLTLAGAAKLFGRTPEAVRVATVQGHVRTCLVLRFGKHPIRLIELKSAQQYWTHTRPGLAYGLQTLKKMEERASVLEVSGKRYRILTTQEEPLVVQEPPCPHGSEWPCAKPPCNPLWFRWFDEG